MTITRTLRGFSLTSLIVTIAIIMFLLALLVPSLINARRKAQRTLCAVNLRSLGQAHTLYRADFHALPLSYRGADPTASYVDSSGNIVMNQDILFDNATWRDYRWPGLPALLEPYIQAKYQLFICPATPSANPVPLVWKDQISPGAAATPIVRGSYEFFLGDTIDNSGGNGRGNQTYYYPGTPPNAYPGYNFPVKDVTINLNTIIAMDRYHGEGGTDTGPNKAKNKNKGGSTLSYSNHTDGTALWQPDVFTSTNYNVGIYQANSDFAFKGINMLRLDGSVYEGKPSDLTQIMIKVTGLGNAPVFSGPFPP